MQRLVLLVVVAIAAAACGKDKGKSDKQARVEPKPPPPAPAAADAAPAVPAAVECPDEEALAPIVASAVKAAPDHINMTLCAPGKFPAPGWFVFAWVADPKKMEDDPSDYRARHLLVIDPASKAVVAAAPVGKDGGRMLAFGDPRLADLDGDGIDEITFEGFYSESGAADSWLEVWRVDGKQVVATGKGNIALEATGYGADDCKADVAIEPRPGGKGADLVVTRKLVKAEDPGPGEEKLQCDVGTKRWTVQDGKLK